MLEFLKSLLLLGLAGAAGALSRYALAGCVQDWCGARFPWGTLAVNLLGLCSILAGLMLGRWLVGVG